MKTELLNNRTRSVLFIDRLSLSQFEKRQKIAELHKKGQLFSDQFLDKHAIPKATGGFESINASQFRVAV